MRRDILCYARILQLTIYLETNNTLSIEHLVKSSRYFFSTREKLHKHEEVLLLFFQRIYLITEEKEKIDLYLKLHAELIQISKNSSEKQVIFYTNEISWVESKIKNTSFVEIIKSKNNFIFKNNL